MTGGISSLILDAVPVAALAALAFSFFRRRAAYRSEERRLTELKNTGPAAEGTEEATEKTGEGEDAQRKDE